MASASRNHRLETAMLTAGISADQVAARMGVDPRTVRHWLSGRIPYPRHQGPLAQLLGADPLQLWPRNAEQGEAAEELVAIYTHRADSPATLWRTLLTSAMSNVDFLGYAILFLFELQARLPEILARKAQEGCQIRIAIVDPTSQQAADRDAEERINQGLIARIRMAIQYFSPLLGCPGVEIRLHRSPMYNSVFRFDEQMLVTPHLYATPGQQAPLLHIRRNGSDGLFDNFASHFDAVWEPATAMEQG